MGGAMAKFAPPEYATAQNGRTLARTYALDSFQIKNELYTMHPYALL